jgi:hypothetical protein
MFTADINTTATLVRIKLATTAERPDGNDWPACNRADRELSKLAYTVAIELEEMGIDEELGFVVDASGARDGVIRIELTEEGTDTAGLLLEMAIEACANCNVGPRE